jgi:hypothetical protein
MIDDFDTRILPGDGVAVRARGIALLVLPQDGQHDATGELVELVLSVSAERPSSGRHLARRLAATLSGANGDDAPPFALVADESGSVVVFVHGPLTVDLGVGESVSISGGEAATWVDRLIDSPVTSIRLAGDSGDTSGCDAALRVSLCEGVVPARAIQLSARQPAESDAIPPVPEPVLPPPPMAMVPDDPTSEVPADEPSTPPATLASLVPPSVPRPALALVPDAPEDHQPERHADGVLVEGIPCSRDHINDPKAVFCAACGISLIHRTHNVVVGQRPPLGFLVADDGVSYSLDRGYVVGRQPGDDPRVADGSYHPLVVDDPDRRISRVHAEVVLDGWDVKVIDRGSTNGTFVFDAINDRWQQLPPGVAHVVGPSTRLAFGSRTFIFETPHRAPATGAPLRRVAARGAP